MVIFPAAPVFDADAAEPAAVELAEPLNVVDAAFEVVAPLDPVVEADALAAVEEGVILGPGPDVIMSPFPPGYVPPPAAVKSCGTWVSLLA